MATNTLSAAITNPLSIEVMAAATHPYRVPLREGDPLYPPLSERLPVQGLAGCTNEKCNLWHLRLMKEHNRLAWAAARHLAAPTHKNRFGGEH